MKGEMRDMKGSMEEGGKKERMEEREDVRESREERKRLEKGWVGEERRDI